MSREAFLKSSQPVDPEPEAKESDTTSGPQRSPDNGVGSFSSPSRPREETPVADVPSARAGDGVRTKEQIQPITAREPLTAKERNQPHTAEPEPVTTSRGDSFVTVEAVTVESEADDPDTPGIIDAEASPAVLQPIIETDTSGIEEQLTQLLSEDLNALRESRSKSVDTATTKPDEPAVPPTETPRSDPAVSSGSPSEGSDPFAFDLGPSPFAPKGGPEDPVPAAPAVQSSVSPSGPTRPATLPDYGSRSSAFGGGSHANGSPANGSHVSTIAPGPTKIGPLSAEPPPAAKPRQTFAVPSVSATLGPSRKLEPLSDAFRPAGFPQEKAIPPAELAPEPVYRPELFRTPEPPAASVRNESNDGVLRRSSSPPALTTSTESGLDRPMEDAVADLLRPLLKTWLAENMPKIVERALRREMSERLLPGHKNPHD
jgi:hypothetical protein